MAPVRVVEVVSEPVYFVNSQVSSTLRTKLTSNDQRVALAPELSLAKALAGLGVLGVEQVIEEILAVRLPHIALRALSHLLAAEGEVLVAVLVDLAEQNPVQAGLVEPRHRSSLHFNQLRLHSKTILVVCHSDGKGGSSLTILCLFAACVSKNAASLFSGTSPSSMLNDLPNDKSPMTSNPK